jgi:hypothetical protein
MSQFWEYMDPPAAFGSISMKLSDLPQEIFSAIVSGEAIPEMTIILTGARYVGENGLSLDTAFDRPAYVSFEYAAKTMNIKQSEE